MTPQPDEPHPALPAYAAALPFPAPRLPPASRVAKSLKNCKKINYFGERREAPLTSLVQTALYSLIFLARSPGAIAAWLQVFDPNFDVKRYIYNVFRTNVFFFVMQNIGECYRSESNRTSV